MNDEVCGEMDGVGMGIYNITRVVFGKAWKRKGFAR